jgi:muramoyltetrapeptide carboxypeptidase
VERYSFEIIRKMLKGKKLKKGDTIGIVAPANFTVLEKINQGCNQLQKLGFKIKLGKSCLAKWFSFSGNDDLRANDINEMFADKTIDAVLCARGGYGCIRILNKINFDIIKNNPKLFIGFSDITSLHIAINRYAGLTTVHGPMLTSNIADNFDTVTQKSFVNVITGKTEQLSNPPGEQIKILKYGEATGQIIGGTLSLVISSLATEYEIDTKHKLFFLEELNEYTYRIDKMLIQLKLAGKFNDCSGVILGDFKNCNEEKPEDFPLLDVFKNIFADFEKPVIYNFKSGHCCPMISVPFGVECKLSALEKKTYIKLLENTVP